MKTQASLGWNAGQRSPITVTLSDSLERGTVKTTWDNTENAMKSLQCPQAVDAAGMMPSANVANRLLGHSQVSTIVI
jgi:hypothetical protein